MRKTMCMILVIIFALLLISCGDSSSEKETNLETMPVDGEQSYDTPIGDSSVSFEPAPLDHITDDSYDNVFFDAEIVMTQQADELCILKRENLNILPEDIVNAFSPYFTLNYETRTSSSGELRDRFTVSGADVDIRSTRYRFAIYSDYDEIINLTFVRDEGSALYNANHFSQTYELDFLTRSDARGQVLDILGKLGLGEYVSEDIEIYALTQESLKSAFDQILSYDPSFDEIIQAHGGRSGIKECYYIFVPFQINGIPLLDDSFTYVTKEIPISQSGASVIISEDGFVHFLIEGYLPGNAVSDPASVIPLDKAMSTINSIYDLIILSEKLTITKITLIYLPNTNSLIPAYGFQTWQNDIPIWIYINALTGEQII